MLLRLTKLMDEWIFILKLLIISAMLSIGIKYLIPLLNIPATAGVALSLVIAPTVFVAIALGWRGWQFQKQQNKN